MKIVLQRVEQASVCVDGVVVGSIGCGYLILLGIGTPDTKSDAEKAVEKIRTLRIFADENGKINRSITDVNGEILVISQFTLYADCKKGNRPGFNDAAPPEQAQLLYDHFIAYCRGKFARVEQGVFGADMKVSLVNDGPFTLVL